MDAEHSVNRLYRGCLAHLRDDPFIRSDALEIHVDGGLLVSPEGAIVASGTYANVIVQDPGAMVIHCGDAWILPGLVDAHCHYPQYYATAAYGRDLLDWLHRSVFPAEARYADGEFARSAAANFVGRLAAHGTTTAMVFGSQYLEANLALFDAARASGIRLIAGMTMMDQAAPDALLHSPYQAVEQAESLMDAIASDSLLHYAVTPRFALSCSAEMLRACGDLLRRHPQVYLQTHINESLGEIEAVRALYPDDADYLAVYERFGLIGSRTMLAHDIHVTDSQLGRIADSGCAVCHCPGSNLYLGSGLFSLLRHLDHGIRVAVGTDVGAGPRFSLWQELAEVYKVQQVQGVGLDGARLLYLGTLGGARALNLDHETGNFAMGKSADFWILDPADSPYLSSRLGTCESKEEQLFALLHLATETDVRATYVAGRRIQS